MPTATRFIIQPEWTTLPQWRWLTHWLGQPESQAMLAQHPALKLCQILSSADLELPASPDLKPENQPVSPETPLHWIEMACNSYERFLSKNCRNQQRQQGIYYTPAPVVDHLVRQALKLCRKPPQSVVDPACGTGNFLLSTLNHWPGQACQIAGFDTDPVALMLAEARVVMLANMLGIEIEARFEVTCVLLDTSPVAWDLILGNPPYVSEVRRSKQADTHSIFEQLAHEQSLYYRPKMDLCDAFTAWSVDHLISGGVLGFVLPVYWTQRSASAHLRDKLWQEGLIRQIWDFGGKTLFDAAPGHHSSLLLWQNDANNSPEESYSILSGQGELAAEQPSLIWKQTTNDHRFVWDEPGRIHLLAHLAKQPPLLEASQIQQGIILPQGKLRASDWNQLPAAQQEATQPGEGIFLLSDAERIALALSPEESFWLKPFFPTRSFQAFTGWPSAVPDEWLIYGTAEFRQSIEQFPTLKQHLDRFAPILTSDFAPYGLHRPRQRDWFETGIRIFGLRQVAKPRFAVIDYPAYVQEGFLVIRSGKSVAEAQAICALLNSDLARFWFYYQKRKGERLQIDKDVLTGFPKPAEWSEALIETLAALYGHFASNPAPQAYLNDMVAECYGLSSEERQTLLDWVHQMESSENN